ncbi:hypothetical protein RRG08_022565 [Elysia crispata]|uniref:Uncharacterized protein n=1 Tax=Elysia crispata TaxID=231223 RepID=A0AAE0Z1N0_9GAST|nr:hypothetical protein RRG08_022565 [Elysia crispata]
MADFDFNESRRARVDVARGAFADDTPLNVYTPNDTITPGGFAETSFIDPNVNAYGRQIDAYGRPIDTLYDKSTRDGSAFDTPADVHNYSETSFINLPNPPRITPSSRPGDNIVNLRDELADSEAAAKKIALVNEFYQSIAENYEGLSLPEKIPYDQFKISRDGKTLYWTPEEGKVISIISSRGGGFLALSTLASKYGNGGTEAIRKSMGLKEYDSNTRKTGKLSPKVEKNVQQAYDNILPAEDADDITLDVVDHTIASTEIATEALDEELTPEQSAALGTIDDPPLDLEWVTPARMKLRELSSEMTRMRDSLVNNEAKLSELKEHLAKERRKLEEAPDEATRNRIDERIKRLEDEMATHLFVFGLLCLLGVFLVSTLGNVLQVALTVFGLTAAPVLGVMSLGMFCPWANTQGALWGLCGSVSIILALCVATRFSNFIDWSSLRCIRNCELLNFSNFTFTDVGEASMAGGADLSMLSFSYIWFAMVAITSCITIGLVVSLVTGPEDPETINSDLLVSLCDVVFPFFYLPESFRSRLRINRETVPMRPRRYVFSPDESCPSSSNIQLGTFVSPRASIVPVAAGLSPSGSPVD